MGTSLMPHFQTLWACKSLADLPPYYFLGRGVEGWRQVWLKATTDTKSRGVLFHLHIYSTYITYEFVTGCSSTWHKLGIYIYIFVDKGSIIPGGSKVRKLSFQVTKCYNHTLSQLVDS